MKSNQYTVGVLCRNVGRMTSSGEVVWEKGLNDTKLTRCGFTEGG